MYKTLHKKQGSVTVQLRFARSSVTFCAKRDRYDPKDIKRILNISEREYNQAILEFRLYENICILKGGK